LDEPDPEAPSEEEHNKFSFNNKELKHSYCKSFNFHRGYHQCQPV